MQAALFVVDQVEVDYLMVPLRPLGKKTPLLVALPPVTI